MGEGVGLYVGHMDYRDKQEERSDEVNPTIEATVEGSL